MISIGEVISMGTDAASGLKAMAEAVKVLREVRSSAAPKTQELLDGPLDDLRQTISELQSKQLELQNAALRLAETNLKLTEEHRAAREELSRLQQFDLESKRYERVPLALNTFAYREREFIGPADKQPLLCPNCFDRRIKNYLSFKGYAAQSSEMTCSSCGTSVHVPRDTGPAVMTGRVKRGWAFFEDF